MKFNMNILIIIAFLVATVLLSIVLEKLFSSPTLVSTTIFAIFLIVLTILYAVGVVTDFSDGLIIVIIFTAIAFLTARIFRFGKCMCKSVFRDCCTDCNRYSIENNISDETNSAQDENLLTVSCKCNNGNNQDILSINSNCLNSENNNKIWNRNCYRR